MSNASPNIQKKGRFGVPWERVAEQIEKQGAPNPRIVDDPFSQDTFLYLHEDARAYTKTSTEEHLRNMVDFITGKSVVWHRWAANVLEDFCANRSNVFWGPANAGKSYPLAAIHLADLYAAPLQTVVLVITDKMSNHKIRFFGKLVDFWLKMPAHLKFGTLRESLQNMGVYTAVKGEVRGVICRAMDTGEAAKQLKKVVGSHPPRFRLIIEEAQACNEAVLSVYKNAAASGDYRENAMCNPCDWTGVEGRMSDPLDGDRQSCTLPEKIEWRSRRRVCGEHTHVRVFDGRNSPAIENPELARQNVLPHPANLKEIGSDHSAWSWTDWSQVIGRIIPSGLSAVLLQASEWDEGEAESRAIWLDSWKEIAALDLSGAKDKDKCKLHRLRYGLAVGGRPQVSREETREIKIDVTDSKTPDFTQIASQVLDALSAWGLTVSDLAGDASGQQGTILSAIETYAAAEKGSITQIRSEGRPTSRKIYPPVKVVHGDEQELPTQRRTPKERFCWRSDELLFNTSEAIRLGICRSLSTEIKDQITSRRVLIEKGKGQAEPKKDWRERHGGGSPDDLDALAVGIDKLIGDGFLTFDLAPENAPQKPPNSLGTKAKELSERYGHQRVQTVLRRGR